jgi:hypothetical protein
MVCLTNLVVLSALGDAGSQQTSGSGKSEPRAVVPVRERTFTLAGVVGAADRTGIRGRIDHMRYDPATKRLFIACAANGSLEVIDLDSGMRAGTVEGLRGSQGVAIAGDSFHVTTGDDRKLHRFDTRTLSPRGVVSVGEDAE